MRYVPRDQGDKPPTQSPYFRRIPRRTLSVRLGRALASRRNGSTILPVPEVKKGTSEISFFPGPFCGFTVQVDGWILRWRSTRRVEAKTSERR
jgi:hypothetical protein